MAFRVSNRGIVTGPAAKVGARLVLSAAYVFLFRVLAGVCRERGPARRRAASAVERRRYLGSSPLPMTINPYHHAWTSHMHRSGLIVSKHFSAA